MQSTVHQRSPSYSTSTFFCYRKRRAHKEFRVTPKINPLPCYFVRLSPHSSFSVISQNISGSLAHLLFSLGGYMHIDPYRIHFHSTEWLALQGMHNFYDCGYSTLPSHVWSYAKKLIKLKTGNGFNMRMSSYFGTVHHRISHGPYYLFICSSLMDLTHFANKTYIEIINSHPVSIHWATHTIHQNINL